MSLHVSPAVYKPRYLLLGKRISVSPGEQPQVRWGILKLVFQRSVPVAFNSMASRTMLQILFSTFGYIVTLGNRWSGH